MKSSIFRTISGIFIFFLILSTAFLAVRPVYTGITRFYEYFEKSAFTQLENKSGLTVKYRSLSPSILNKIVVRDVAVCDAETGSELVTINRIAVSYSLRKILAKQVDKAFSKITVGDISIKLDKEKISSLKSRLPSSNAPKDFHLIANSLIRFIPFDVLFRNISFMYSDPSGDYSFSVKQLDLKKNKSISNLYFKINGLVSARLERFDGTVAGAVYSMEGILIENLSGSSIKVRFDDYSRARYSVRKMEYLITCDSSTFFIRSTQRVNPYEIIIKLDTEKKFLSGSFVSDHFDPFSVVKLKKKKKVLNFFSGTKFTTSTDFNVDLTSKAYSWNSETTAYLPKGRRFSKEGETVYAKASGDNRYIRVKKMTADGGRCKGQFDGTFDLKKLQPSGVMEIEYFTYFLNENKISGDLYFEPVKNGGFNCFIPQVNFGTQFYSGLEIFCSLSGTSIDVSLEGYEYSHVEYENPAHIQVSCSIATGKNPYLQASGTFENLFADTGLITGVFFTSPKYQKNVEKLIQPFTSVITSFDVFFSTDFKTFSYNSPMFLIANTSKDREVLVLSVDGNESSVSASRFDLVYGKNSLNGNFDIDYSSGVTFLTEFNFNSIPYSIDGSYFDKNFLNISGSYGLDAHIAFGKNFGGTLIFSSFPVKIGNYIMSFSLDTSFAKSNGDWTAAISKFEVEEVTQNFRAKPRLSLTGELNSKSFVVSAVSYSDVDSVLSGSGYSFWNFNEKNFSNANLSFNLSDPMGSEKILITCELTNPLLKKLDLNTIRSELYMNLAAEVDGLPVSRFLVGQTENNTISAGITASGTIDNPYITFDLRKAEVLFGGATASMTCSVQFMENQIDVSNAAVSWGKVNIKDVVTSVNLNDFNGTASADVLLNISGKTIETTLGFILNNLTLDKVSLIPESFSVTMECRDVKSDIVNNFVPFSLSFIRSPGRIDIMSDENLGAYGELLDTGEISFIVRDDKPIHFALDGTIKNQIVDWNLNNLYFDAVKFISPLNSDAFSFYSGELNGNLHLAGNITDPDMEGMVVVNGADFNIPCVFSEHFRASEFEVEFSREQITIPDTLFYIKDGIVSANALARLDHWNLDSVELSLETLNGKDIPVNSKLSFISLKGYSAVDADVIYEDGTVTLNGSVSLRNTDINVSLNTAVQERAFKKDDQELELPDLLINLDILVGNKVQIAINPLMRALIAPSTPIIVSADTSTGLWTLKGDVTLRGGEISYLSRNFYLKEGRLNFNESQGNFDPNVTVLAEIREHDMNGEPVTISLSAIRQNVSSFHAVLSSIPAKSEYELMQIMGQVASGDSSSVQNLLVAGMDYGVSVTLLRKLETALRDLCNFDIFSVRTTILQNSIMQGFNLNSDFDNRSVISNLFDNSTVYIGKYFGNAIYADAMLHWTYDRSLAHEDETGGGLVFKPEFGVELDAPFANIRWNIAPDLADFSHAWVNSSSLTLSWRIAF